MKNKKTLMLVEGAVMVALSFALSFVKLFALPQGGSITLLSLLPITVYGIRNGWKAGLGAGFVLSLFMFFQGISEGLLGWLPTKTMLAISILFDYFIPFTCLGLAGLFKAKTPLKQSLSIAAVLLVKFFCHFISGVICYGEYAAAWGEFFARHKTLYSACYNSYNLVELVTTSVAAFFILKNPAISKKIAHSKA
ncbi:thiamine transporter [Ruminococcus sp. YE71]|uniref:energy-coupled thiamine transporter ThiT n=1 Tax=unclassified Ruminococcus TaxID=2608920 RepID=UPI000890E8D3|nr:MULTISPECIES: energy-coupled thiamine transporter ThiT [unclassified Ruminococcus]SDA21677.1 thiamine transporter [Ruminococcus sp. YE78]SFW36699.1 thiamine transporter [Ruminococcus sp. YE71]